MLKKSLALAGVLGLTAAAPASAQLFESCFTNGSLYACASANLEATGNPNEYTVTLTNVSASAGTAWNLTGFGFYSTGDLGKLATLSGTIPANWSDAPPTGTTTGGTRELNVAGVPDNSFYWLHADCAGNPNACGLGTSGSSLVFTFTLSDNLPEEFAFGWRGQSVTGLDGIGSIKCFEGFSEEGEESTFECSPPETVIPEPATMVLLATGLVGLGGAQFVRRRRKNNV